MVNDGGMRLVYLSSLLYHPYLVCIPLGMPFLHLFFMFFKSCINKWTIFHFHHKCGARYACPNERNETPSYWHRQIKSNVKCICELTSVVAPLGPVHWYKSPHCYQSIEQPSAYFYPPSHIAHKRRHIFVVSNTKWYQQAIDTYPLLQVPDFLM